MACSCTIRQLLTRFVVPLLVAGGLAGGLAGGAAADIFVLDNDGRIEGVLLNPDESPREKFIVRLDTGGQVTLSPAQVKRVIGLSQIERRYQELLPRMPATADGNWKMAEWCREVGLKDRREQHLKKVVELDPDHEGARYGLGYSRVEGRWVDTDEWNRRQGYVLRGGSWRLRQEVELEERQDRAQQAEKDWFVKLRMWRGWLFGRNPRKREEARREFAQIKDVRAGPALADMLEDEENHELKKMYMEILGRIGGRSAVDALFGLALEDADARIRERAVDQLEGIAGYRGQIVRQAIDQLDSKENLRVNRAAIILGRLGNDSAVMPLIDALVTEHKYKIATRGGNMGASFGGPSRGGGGLGTFSAGNRPKVVVRNLQNRSVLNALVALTDGANFQFDEERWKDWYARSSTPDLVNLRRDE